MARTKQTARRDIGGNLPRKSHANRVPVPSCEKDYNAMTVANLKVKITELGGSISDVIPSRKGKAVIKADLLSYIEDLVKKKNDVISAKKDDVVSEKSTKEISSTGSRSKKSLKL